MKKILFACFGAITLCLLSFSAVQAQVHSNSFQLIGGANTGINTNAPTNTLDVNGTTRLRVVNQNDQLRQVLVIDGNGVVHWRDQATIGTATDNDWIFNGPNIIYNNPATRVGVSNQNPAANSLLHVGTGPGNSLLRIGSVEGFEDIAGNTMQCRSADFVPTGDCAYDLGQSNGLRWDRLFACRGVFQTAVAVVGGKEMKKSATLGYGLEEVMAMKPIAFTCEECDFAGRMLGLPAQDLKAIVPEAVYDPAEEIRLDEDGTPVSVDGDMMINYTTLVPVLIKAIQEQQERIEQDAQNTAVMMEKIDALQKELEAIRNKSGRVSPADQSLGLNEEAILFQNQPNPFSTESAIRYFLPAGTTNASLVFHGIDGREIHRIALEGTGLGSAKVNASELNENSVSFYSLIINGEKVDTRKMLQIHQD